MIKKRNKNLVIITYNNWSSDARAKASKDIYLKLGYKLHVYSPKEKNYLSEKNVFLTHGLSKYLGNSLVFFVMSHLFFMFLASIWMFRKCISLRNFKYVHIHNMPDYLIFIGIIGKIFRKKIIWDVRDITPAVWFSKKYPSDLTPHGSLYKIMRFVFKLSGKLANSIICADMLQKKYIEEIGFKRKKLKVFLNLPLENVFIWKDIPTKTDPFRLIYHGTITYRLGIDAAIKAVVSLDPKLNILFDIVGDGDYKSGISKLIKDLKAENRINFKDEYIPVEEIPAWSEGAHGAIIPNRKTFSTNSYMLPHKMLEDIKMGIPVIVPKLKNVSSYLFEGEAIFYKPEDIDDLKRAILHLFNMKIDERKQLSVDALKIFERNTYEKNYLAIKEILES